MISVSHPFLLYPERNSVFGVCWSSKSYVHSSSLTKRSTAPRTGKHWCQSVCSRSAGAAHPRSCRRRRERPLGCRTPSPSTTSTRRTPDSPVVGDSPVVAAISCCRGWRRYIHTTSRHSKEVWCGCFIAANPTYKSNLRRTDSLYHTRSTDAVRDISPGALL